MLATTSRHLRSQGVCLLLAVCAALADNGSDAPRELRVRVVDEEHLPAAGVEVRLLGLDRGPMTMRSEIFPEPGETNSEKSRGWKFITDANGRGSVQFGKFDFSEHLKTSGVIEPGYGSYFLIVEKENYAGGVSAKLLNLSEEQRNDFAPTELEGSGPNEGEEWNYDERLLNDDPQNNEEILIVLQRGIDVSGQLVDEKNRPIKGEQINLWNDLGADTHTGRGGEIFERQAVTDRFGRFHFHHVYPNLFHLALQSQDSDALSWIKTRVRKRWVDGVNDAIWPHTDDTDLALVIVASRQRPFHYFGKVTDEKARPIAGATVRVQASLHGPCRRGDFEDDHDHHSQVITRADGTYDVAAAGAYVNDFQISAPGFGDEVYREDGEINGFDRYEEVPCAPGRYDFVLKKK